MPEFETSVGMTKYIFVTGGVVSSLGKGITAASLGRLLKSRGLKVQNQKLDPYLNLDPGTMNPYQHGEVFVTEDGAETDLDLGHYERFVDVNLTGAHSVTSGKIFHTVLDKERRGDYLGATVQIIPHITREIKECILRAAVAMDGQRPDVVICEIGGTVGDIEGQPFLEAVRQFRREVGRNNCLFLHVTLVPYLNTTGEAKTKPTQHSVKELRSVGLQPDIIVCRSERPLPENLKQKIALFCDVGPEAVIYNTNTESLYEIPLLLHQEGLDDYVCRILHLEAQEPDLVEWQALVKTEKNPKNTVTVALVGKYVQLHDAYLSVAEALHHAGIAGQVKIDIRWVDAEHLEDASATLDELAGCQAILVPGGFGDRGLEGKIAACQYAREKQIPFLGICLGMQMAVIEYARNVLGMKGAHSSEIAPDTAYPVIDLMEEQRSVREMGGTMRLGRYLCKLTPGSLAAEAYGEAEVWERHRHRYEFNNFYREAFAEGGMRFAGLNVERDLVEIIELPAHRWYMGVQFHPEFKSRPNRAHPLFREFVAAALRLKEQQDEETAEAAAAEEARIIAEAEAEAAAIAAAVKGGKAKGKKKSG